jgi:hypothetical protein
VNGGAWLTIDGTKVDLIYRDLGEVLHWTAAAEDGKFEIHREVGYVAGIATYVLAGNWRRPRLDYESHAVGLDRNEVGTLLVAAGPGAPVEHALISLHALNGLRVLRPLVQTSKRSAPNGLGESSNRSAVLATTNRVRTCWEYVIADSAEPCERQIGTRILGVKKTTSQRDVAAASVQQPQATQPKRRADVAAVESQKVAPNAALASPIRSRKDDWFVWLLALASLIVPAIVLVCVDSIPRDALAWHAVRVSIGRGDFLIPAMALCVETIRRWWRDVDSERWLGPRLLATAVSSLSSLVCIIAMTTAASLPVTPQTASSVAVITVSTLVIGIAFGTAAVAVSRPVVVP